MTEVVAGGEGAILLSELAPVVTLGRRTPSSELLVNRPALKRGGIDILDVDRGGLATWHGPGQWVAFVVDSLERLTGDARGVRRAVDGLLDSALAVSRRHGIEAAKREGAELGLWTSRGKLASVGVQISGGVLLHGIALNCFRTPTSFAGIRPCGLDLPVDWLLRDAESFDGVASEWIVEIQRAFQSKSARADHLDGGVGSGYTYQLPSMLACSSVGEHPLDTGKVVGSIPITPTISIPQT